MPTPGRPPWTAGRPKTRRAANHVEVAVSRQETPLKGVCLTFIKLASRIRLLVLIGFAMSIAVPQFLQASCSNSSTTKQRPSHAQRVDTSEGRDFESSSSFVLETGFQFSSCTGPSHRSKPPVPDRLVKSSRTHVSTKDIPLASLPNHSKLLQHSLYHHLEFAALS